jgi:hemerythrin
MKWSSAFATGIERIDDQHRMLFQMVEDFRDALDHGEGVGVYGGLLRSLETYARVHFAFEEGCMVRHHCPMAGRNQEAHAQFLEVLAGFQQQFAVNGFDPSVALHLMDTLEEWLANHIGRIDVNLKASVEK